MHGRGASKPGGPPPFSNVDHLGRSESCSCGQVVWSVPEPAEALPLIPNTTISLVLQRWSGGRSTFIPAP